MAAAGDIYANAVADAFAGNIQWATANRIKAMLLGSGYTPATDLTEHHLADLTGEISGTGYTAGGQVLTGCTATTTAANSWALSYSTTSFTPALYDVVKPVSPNGFLYQAVKVTGATAGGSSPSWPTVPGQTVVDGGVTWECAGTAITIFTSTAPSWPASTLTGVQFIVIRDYVGDCLINLQTTATSESDSAGTFTETPDPTYGWFMSFAS